MTEHKITAKEQIELRQKTRELSEDVKEVIVDLMNQRAIQVATEAVEENINDWFTHKRRKEAKIHGQNIKDIIKKRLNDKNCEEG